MLLGIASEKLGANCKRILFPRRISKTCKCPLCVEWRIRDILP